MITNEMVNQAIDYIMQHIGEEITIEDVADYCHFSKFYFSRIFKAETGESIYAFIKRIKMEQSAFKLKVEREKTVTDIGFEYGYSPSNYSSAFKQHHNTSPVNFRKNIFHASIEHPFFYSKMDQLESFEECNKKISIQTVEDFTVIYERRIGNYRELGKVWEMFLDKYKDYLTKDSLLLERTFDDPTITDIDNCLYDVCMSVNKGCTLENTCIITGGKFAIYHFKGPIQKIYEAYQSFFNVWFPQSHYGIDERYGFDIYREIDCESMYVVMDIYFPIK